MISNLLLALLTATTVATNTLNQASNNNDAILPIQERKAETKETQGKLHIDLPVAQQKFVKINDDPDQKTGYILMKRYGHKSDNYINVITTEYTSNKYNCEKQTDGKWKNIYQAEENTNNMSIISQVNTYSGLKDSKEQLRYYIYFDNKREDPTWQTTKINFNVQAWQIANLNTEFLYKDITPYTVDLKGLGLQIKEEIIQPEKYDYTQILNKNMTIDFPTNEHDGKGFNIDIPISIYPNTNTYYLVYIERLQNDGGHLNTISNEPRYNNDFVGVSTIYYTVWADSRPYEVLDLPGLIFTILTVPFAFISQAFNLTLFPYTPYQINISQLLMTIIAIIVFVFLIKQIIGMVK